MAQISLEIDQSLLEKIEKVAEQRKTSISNWVRDNIKRTL
jgi:metal-responsive CopG/Arc/MetJ family transcriptional regulator